MAGRMNRVISEEFEKSRVLVEAMAADTTLHAQIAKTVQIAVEAFRSGNKLMFAGNGGSAADAQHWAGELVSRFNFDRPGLPAIALTTDTSILTATSNDYGYDQVFSRQVQALGREGDILFVLSTSGSSRNVLRAIEAARVGGIAVVGFTGRSGGAMHDACDLCFRVPSDETPKIQEGHEMLGHLICNLIEREMFANVGND